ncbi:MAG: GNAT family N-acetyltransferase [Pseudomonadota bacterium]
MRNGFETDRLILDPLGRDHSDGVFALWSDPRVCAHAGIVKGLNGTVLALPATDRGTSDRILDVWLRAIETHSRLRWAMMLKSSHAFVGTIGFKSLSGHYEISFHLLPDVWGQGLMVEAADAAVQWAHDDGADGIAAFVDPKNARSQGLLSRLGLRPTGEVFEGAERYARDF